MPNDFEELKRQLLQSDEEYRQLATRHHDLDEQIHNLTDRHYPDATRTARRSPIEKGQAPPERSDGKHPAPPPDGRRPPHAAHH